MKMDSSASLMPNGGTSGKQKRGSNTNGAIPNNKSSSGVLPSVNYHRQEQKSETNGQLLKIEVLNLLFFHKFAILPILH